MSRMFLTIVAFTPWLGLFSLFGCQTTTSRSAGDAASEGSVALVAAKALDVAAVIGGPGAYGGPPMDDYGDHVPGQMGFNDRADLAGQGQMMTMHFENLSEQECTFRLHYFAGHMGLDEQIMDVVVDAQGQATVEIPCAEIVGLGPLEAPGQEGCLGANGMVIDNAMAVPGFLGLDYACGGTYNCSLLPDLDDLDSDGDTEELILLSEPMEAHLQDGGPTGHRHGPSGGMMGMHF